MFRLNSLSEIFWQNIRFLLHRVMGPIPSFKKSSLKIYVNWTLVQIFTFDYWHIVFLQN